MPTPQPYDLLSHSQSYPPSGTGDAIVKVSRRAFFGSAAAAAGGALVIGFGLRGRLHFTKAAQSPENPFDAWIHINPDNSTKLVFAQSEMGQGVYTALPMLLADEADLDWDRVTIVQSDYSRGTG